MKSRYDIIKKAIYLILIFLLLIINCTPPHDIKDIPPEEDDIGELWVSLIPPSFDLYGLTENNYNSIQSYTIILQKPGKTSIKKENINHFPVIFEMIDVGSWAVTGNAINNEGKQIGNGKTEIIVKKYTRTTIELSLSILFTGDGLFSASFSWPEDVVTGINAQLKNQEDEIQDIAFILSNKEAVYNNDCIPAGKYTLTTELMNDSFSLLTIIEDFSIYGNLKTMVNTEFSIDDFSTCPEAPSNLCTEKGYSCIKLSWQDNSHKEMRYVIERSTEQSSGFTQLGELLPPNTTQFSDKSVIPNILYYYRVYAVNRYGDSDRSKVASGILGIPLPPCELDLIDEDDTGLENTDNITMKQNVTITGKAENGTTVDIFTGSPIKRIASGIIVENGKWSMTITPGEGQHTIKATTSDFYGNMSDYSESLLLTIDTITPETPDISGPFATYEKRPVWTFSLPDDGVLAEYRLDDNEWNTLDYILEGTYQPAIDLQSGAHTLDIKVQDRAGNWSGNGAHTIFILGDAFNGLELSGSWNRPYGKPSDGIMDFAVKDNHIYIAAGQDIKIFNISNPSSPSFAGSIISSIPEVQYHNLFIYHNYLYIINSIGSLLVYDVTAPSNPIFKRTITVISEQADFDIDVDNDFLYILSSLEGLFIFSLDDPSFPALQGGTGNLGLAGNLSSFCITGTTGYIAAKEQGICILDLTEKNKPVSSGILATERAAKNLCITGDTLYVAEEQGIAVFDISTPSAPVAKTTVTSENIISLTAEGDTLYTANGVMGIKVYDITNRLLPEWCIDISVKKTSQAMDIIDNYLFANSFDGGVEIYSISAPTSPDYCSRVSVCEQAMSVYTTNELAFISDGPFGVKIVDITTPSNPVLASAFETKGSVQRLYSDGPYLYIGDDKDGLLIYTISDPLNPVFKGKYTLEEICAFHIENNIAYAITDNGYLHIINITDPGNPGKLHSTYIGGQLKDIIVTGSYAFITNYSSYIMMINVTDPSNPVFEKNINTLNGASELHAAGGFLFIGHNGGALTKLDISNMPETYIIQTNTSFSSVSGIDGDEVFLFVNDSTAKTIKTLHIFDITVVVPNGEYSYDYSGNDLFAHNEYIYMTIKQNEQALLIFNR
ncbi:MAG: hypothetical protein JXB88_04875 [Spirochaetales bacterium]|nr:hypothetical protein [Spirochaetales bacterium]